MKKLIGLQGNIEAAALDFPKNYREAFCEIEQYSQENALAICDLPMAIRAMSVNDTIRKIARCKYLDVLTAEYHGKRDDVSVYEVWHSAGTLSTNSSFIKSSLDQDTQGFSVVDNDEWIAMGCGDYHDVTIPRIDSLSELRAGNNIPDPGFPYICSLTLDPEFQLIPLNVEKNEVLKKYNKNRVVIFESGQLNSWQFKLDDRMLCLCGSPSNRDLLWEIIFKKVTEGGEGRADFGSHHEIHSSQENPRFESVGRRVFFYNDNTGIVGRIYGYGNFIAVSKRILSLHPHSGPVFTDDKVREGMIEVKGGIFEMGSPDDEEYMGDYQISEHPRHAVGIDSFFMDTMTVTQKEYVEIMNTNPSTNIGADLPVIDLTWYDAVLFCNAKSKRYGLDPVYDYTAIIGNAGNGCEFLENLSIDARKDGYRLPTEAEWEFACRAGSKTRFFWGEEMDGDYAWSEINTDPIIRPVGLKRPNLWGFHDMAGNVQEWCGDWFAVDYYSNSPEKNPIGPSSGEFRVLRGGSNYPYKDWDRLRSANRSCSKPNKRGGLFGFRTVTRRLLHRNFLR
jgi:formylglycine-generating enzyme required for sulfatase activity